MTAMDAPARSGVKVSAETDRFGQPFEFLDAWFNVTLSGKDTNGAACSVDTNRKKRGGPPLHVHPEQDEWFFVREGEFPPFAWRLASGAHRRAACLCQHVRNRADARHVLPGGSDGGVLPRRIRDGGRHADSHGAGLQRTRNARRRPAAAGLRAGFPCPKTADMRGERQSAPG